VRVNELRRQRNWSQRELSEHAYRIDRAYISRIESGVVEPCLTTIGELVSPQLVSAWWKL
jgi:transcriptional regulator with XRE-family HTH domain